MGASLQLCHCLRLCWLAHRAMTCVPHPDSVEHRLLIACECAHGSRHASSKSNMCGSKCLGSAVAAGAGLNAVAQPSAAHKAARRVTSAWLGSVPHLTSNPCGRWCLTQQGHGIQTPLAVLVQFTRSLCVLCCYWVLLGSSRYGHVPAAVRVWPIPPICSASQLCSVWDHACAGHPLACSTCMAARGQPQMQVRGHMIVHRAWKHGEGDD